MADLQNLTETKNASSGISEYVYIALKEWFITNGIKKPTSGVTITQNHQFINGLFGFLECQLAPSKNHLTVKSIGELMGNKFEFDLEVFIPGSYAENHGIQKQLLNKPLVVLIKDLCGNNVVYQLGTEDKPAYLTHHFTTGTDKDGQKGYKVNIVTTGCFVQLYSGHIKVFEPPFPNNGVPAFFSTDVINNSSLQSIIDAYTNAFTTNISKIISLISTKASNEKIQLEFRTSNAEVISVRLDNIDCSTPLNFINEVYGILNATIETKGLQLIGSKLIVTTLLFPYSYLGFALVPISNHLTTENDEDIVTENNLPIIV